MIERSFCPQTLYQWRCELDRVVDGDTVDVYVDVGFSITLKRRVRLVAVETYEIYKKKNGAYDVEKGVSAMEYLAGLLRNRNLILRSIRSKEDKYGRILGEIFRQNLRYPGFYESVNQLMVDSGHAWEVNRVLRQRL